MFAKRTNLALTIDKPLFFFPYLIEESLASVPESFLGENGVRNPNGPIQRIVDERRRAHFLHLTPGQPVDSA